MLCVISSHSHRKLDHSKNDQSVPEEDRSNWPKRAINKNKLNLTQNKVRELAFRWRHLGIRRRRRSSHIMIFAISDESESVREDNNTLPRRTL